MVLVKGEYRRRGLATQLMRRGDGRTRAQGRVPVLDATPDGRAVYRRLGFEETWGFPRLSARERQRAAACALAGPADVTIRADRRCGLAGALRLRRRGLRRRPRRRACAACAGGCPPPNSSPSAHGRIVGLRARPRRRQAAQIGPLIADDDDVAHALLARALDRLDGPVYVDLADSKAASCAAGSTRRGFAAQRPLTRMLSRSSTRFDDAARTFAVIGPEFG